MGRSSSRVVPTAAKLLAAFSLCIFLGAIGGWAFSRWNNSLKARPNSAANSPLLFNKPIHLVDASRATLLSLIPAPGAKLEITGASLPQDISNAVQAMPIPLADPIQIARSADPADPKMLEWLERWRTDTSQEKPVAKTRRGELDSVLEVTPMDEDALFRLGRAYGDVAGDSLTESQFFVAAVRRAHQKLGGFPPASPQARQILVAMNDSRRTLWDVMDNVQAGNRGCLESLALIGRDILNWSVPGDSLLADARNHAFIGVPECMLLSGDANDAIPLLAAIDRSPMTSNEKLGVAWISGLACYRAGRFVEAADQFRSVAADSSYQYSNTACKLSALSLVRVGKRADADAALDEWIARYRPDPTEVGPVLTAMATVVENAAN